MNDARLKELESICREMRCDIIEMLGSAQSGHPGGSLSAVEILTYLYFEAMHIDPENPTMEDRDRFVLSKGHAAPVLYAALAERGFIEKELLKSLRQLKSPLQGHPDMRKVPGVDLSTGSLGTGFSGAVGIALAGKLDKSPRYTYCLLGDGELQEGQVWEAAMAAAHYELSHLIVYCDNNGLQIDGAIKDVMNPAPIDEKFRAFGFEVFTIDGNDLLSVAKATEEAKASSSTKPKLILCHTKKGCGVSFMENQASWHGKAPSADEVALALTELRKEESHG